MYLRREHSWPSGDYLSYARKFTISRKNESDEPITGKDTFNPILASDLLLYSSADEGDILSSAGIVDTKRETLWQRKRARREKLIRQLRGQGIVGFQFKDLGDDDSPGESIVSSITEANKAPAAKLRRYVWPHLERARQLLNPIHNFNCLSSLTEPAYRPAGMYYANQDNRTRYMTKLASSSAPTLPLIVSPGDGGLPQLMVGNEWVLHPGRRHRRCHSEQPRAWREPSPGLWTLAEE